MSEKRNFVEAPDGADRGPAEDGPAVGQAGSQVSGQAVGPVVKRNTWQKDAVRHALGEATGFVGAQQLHLALRNHGSTIGLATVYRALADLATNGDADSLQSQDGEVLYRACTTDHHHHLICRDCGLTVEIEAERVETWADEVAKAQGFANPSHTIDIFGTCTACQGRNIAS